MTATLAGLLAAICQAPDLPGALCKGLNRLFDPAEQHEPAPEVERRHRIALETCRACPALDRCREWFDGLPKRDRPQGVIAGLLVHPPAKRKRVDVA